MKNLKKNTYITENHIFMFIIIFRGFDSYENDTKIANLFSCDWQVGRGKGFLNFGKIVVEYFFTNSDSLPPNLAFVFA